LTQPVILLLRGDASKVRDLRKTAMYRINAQGTWSVAGMAIHNAEGLALTVEQTGTYALYENIPSFADLENHWGKDAIEVLAAQHIVNGTGKGFYTPNAIISRSHFLMMLDRLPHHAGTEASMKKSERFANESVNGVGKSADKADKEPFTRAEMVALLAQKTAKVMPTTAKSHFTDTAHLDQSNQAAIAYTVDKGWIQGVGSGRFGSDQTPTRAQAAMLIYRYLKSMNQL